MKVVTEIQLPDDIFSSCKKFWKFQKRYIFVVKFHVDCICTKVYDKNRLLSEPFFTWNIVHFRKPKTEEYHLMMLKPTQFLSKNINFWKIFKKIITRTFSKFFFLGNCDWSLETMLRGVRSGVLLKILVDVPSLRKFFTKIYLF